MKLLFLNGFDRCGSSLIGGLLSKHPEVAYFFQPFNRTEVHASQYELWEPDQSFPDSERFLRGLLAGRVERDLLGADLFDEHSTKREPQAGKLNVVKETKLHFKLRWLRARFPAIELRGIWRDPRGIVCSLLRNGFGADWYGPTAFEALGRTVRATSELSAYVPLLERALEDYERLALIVAARTHMMCLSLRADEWLMYEQVLMDCDAVLNGLIAGFGLAPFAFSVHLGEDFNVVGKPSAGPELWRTYFSRSELGRLDAIFGLLEPVQPSVQSDFRSGFQSGELSA